MTDRRLSRRQLMMGSAGALALAGSGIARRVAAQEIAPRRGGVPMIALPRMPEAIGDAVDTGWESGWVRSLIYDSPFRTSMTGDITAGISIGYLMQPDSRSVTIPTRNGVTFSSGEILTARDIASSIERAIDIQADDDAWRWDRIEAVAIGDDDRVQLHLREPDVTLPATLASPLVPVVPEGTGQGRSGKALPPGTGPFLPAQRNGDTLRFRRNGWHWVVGQPRFDGCNVTMVEQDVERASWLVTGLVDIVPGVPSLDIPLLEDDPGVTLYGGVSRRQCALVMRTDGEPLNDVRVRRMIAAVIDRESMVSAATAGIALPSNWLFPPEHWAGDPGLGTDPPMSPEEIRNQLAEIGLLPGWPLRLVCPDTSPTLANAAILLQEQCATAGIALRIDLIDDDAMADATEARDFDLLVAYLPTWIDPHEIAHPRLHSEGVRNAGGFSSLRLDRLLALARTESDQERRGAYYREIQRIVLSQLPLVPLFAVPWIDGLKTSIAGYDAAFPPSGRGISSAWLMPP